MIRAFLFDLDGTLVLSEHLKSRSYAQAIRDLSLKDYTETEVLDIYKQQVGQTREKMSTFLMELESIVTSPEFELEEQYRNL